MKPHLIKYDRFVDERGAIQRIWFEPAYNAVRLPGWPEVGDWRQENAVITRRGVLRGIHGNRDDGNWTLFTLLLGAVQFAVVEETTGQWLQWCLGSLADRETIGYQVIVPPGWGRAYYVYSNFAVVHYKWTVPYEQQKQFTYRYDRFGIEWQFDGKPLLSDRDENGR